MLQVVGEMLRLDWDSYCLSRPKPVLRTVETA